MIGKSVLPKSLFGRALLILLLPTVLIQLVMAYVFFDRHWDNVTRYMANALAGEVAFLVRQLETMPAKEKSNAIKDFEETTGIIVSFYPSEAFESVSSNDFPEFDEQLSLLIDEEFSVKRLEGAVIQIRVKLPKQLLNMETTVKRLESRTTTIFIWWMLGVTTVLLLIAVIFLRNQIRPIHRLAKAADSFGRGIDTPNFRPHGATEVRMAARAFMVMRERIKRQLRTRTEMLAGISHDLRTPLTRMKLQLAMFKDTDAVRELQDDVQQMEHMIQEYLDFARGDNQEDAVPVSLRDMLEDIVADYRRQHADVSLAFGADVEVNIRLIGFRRMMHNLIDNAIRYGKRCTLGIRTLANACEIVIDDEGAGIPADKREEVFRPFSRLDPSRNSKTGGVGLGLTIARDIVLAHGGGISLEASPKGGLRVVLRLPL